MGTEDLRGGVTAFFAGAGDDQPAASAGATG